MLPKINGGLTANGNLKVQVHHNLKSQYAAKMVDALGLTSTPNGDFAIAIAEADGKVIYARVEFAITTVNPMVEKPKAARKSRTVETIDVPSI